MGDLADIDLHYSVEIRFRVCGIPREDGASPDMAMLNVLASHFGLESTGYGRTLRSKDEIFRITSNRSKCPINAERVNDGRGFNCPTGNVAMRLSSVHALRKYTLCSSKSPNMQLRAPYPLYGASQHSPRDADKMQPP